MPLKGTKLYFLHEVVSTGRRMEVFDDRTQMLELLETQDLPKARQFLHNDALLLHNLSQTF